MKMQSILIATFLLAGAAAAQTQLELARVNDEPITVAELKAEFTRRHGGHDRFLGGMVEANKFLNLIIDQRLLIQEAYNLNLQDDPKVKERTDVFRTRKSIEYLIGQEIDGKAKVTQDDVRAAWEKNTNFLVQTRQIVVDTREEAEQLRTAIEHGGNFETLARECSAGATRMHGGRLAPFGWGTMEPEWEDVVFKLQPGEMSPVFHTSDGWQIVVLDDRSWSPLPDFEKASTKIESILKTRAIERRKKDFSAELFAKYHVQIATLDRSPLSLAKLRTSAPDTVIATWDGGALLLKDLASAADFKALTHYPPGRAAEAIDEQIRVTINEPLTALEAKARNVADLPEVADVVRHFQEEQMEGALYDQHILKDLTVGDAEIQAYYEQHKAELRTPERRHVAHIVVADEAHAKELKQKIVSGDATFEDLVRTKSMDAQSAAHGGDLGWIEKADVPKEFTSVLSLREGDVSDPIKSKFGWHLIKVVKINPEAQMQFEQAKSDIRKRLTEQKQRERREYWVKKLRDAARITISEAKVKAFVKENPLGK